VTAIGAGEPVLRLEHVDIAFGGVRAVHDLSLGIAPGRVTSLIGGNGAGKTTAFNLITGYLQPDAGTIWYRGQRISGWSPHRIARLGIARAFQELRLFNRLSTLDNVLVGLPGQRGERLLAALFGRPGLGAEMRRHEAAGRDILSGLALGQRPDVLAENLSYGQQKLLSLGRLLAARGELLLLDEPTAGLNPQLVAEFCARIRGLVSGGKTVFLIEHNVEVVMSVSDWVIVMHEGQKIAEGPPAVIRSDVAVMHTYLGIAS
jgi:branched-chain amino acid transport system ATP-binding protein